MSVEGNLSLWVQAHFPKNISLSGSTLAPMDFAYQAEMINFGIYHSRQGIRTDFRRIGNNKQKYFWSWFDSTIQFFFLEKFQITFQTLIFFHFTLSLHQKYSTNPCKTFSHLWGRNSLSFFLCRLIRSCKNNKICFFNCQMITEFTTKLPFPLSLLFIFIWLTFKSYYTIIMQRQ